jgi:hypothetical protein
MASEMRLRCLLLLLSVSQSLSPLVNPSVSVYPRPL